MKIIVIHDHAFAIPDLKVNVSSDFKFLHLKEGAVESLPVFLWRIVMKDLPEFS
jgi:hypothetical protein